MRKKGKMSLWKALFYLCIVFPVAIAFFPFTICWLLYKSQKIKNEKEEQRRLEAQQMQRRQICVGEVKVGLDGKYETKGFGDTPYYDTGYSDSSRSYQQNARESYRRQLNESIKLIKETNNISTLFSRLRFLKQLRYNVVTYGGAGLDDVEAEIVAHITLQEEYIDLFILRQYAAANDAAATSSEAVRKRKIKTVYNRIDAYKNKMSENNIKSNTDMAMQGIGVNQAELPQYSQLLVRLNNNNVGKQIPSEYYDEEFGSFGDAVSEMQAQGFLRLSEDGKKYILTMSGYNQVGWL